MSKESSRTRMRTLEVSITTRSARPALVGLCLEMGSSPTPSANLQFQHFGERLPRRYAPRQARFARQSPILQRIATLRVAKRKRLGFGFGSSNQSFLENPESLRDLGVKVKEYKVVDLNMELYEDTQQWAWTPYTLVELESLSKPGVYGNEITEVVTFDIDTIPDEFGWWEKDELEECLRSALKNK